MVFRQGRRSFLFDPIFFARCRGASSEVSAAAADAWMAVPVAMPKPRLPQAITTKSACCSGQKCSVRLRFRIRCAERGGTTAEASTVWRCRRQRIEENLLTGRQSRISIALRQAATVLLITQNWLHWLRAIQPM